MKNKSIIMYVELDGGKCSIISTIFVLLFIDITSRSILLISMFILLLLSHQLVHVATVIVTVVVLQLSILLWSLYMVNRMNGILAILMMVQY